MRTDIVVIGGYGHVGAQICMLLSDRFPGAVYAAGRNLIQPKWLRLRPGLCTVMAMAHRESIIWNSCSGYGSAKIVYLYICRIKRTREFRAKSQV
jgi:nucleoside-diphosphate-sugar epimerase